MGVTDWAAAKAIWQAIKESGLDVRDDVVVFVGVGPDNSLVVDVNQADDIMDSDEYDDLQQRIEELEKELLDLVLTATTKTESYIDPHLKVLRSDS